MALLENYARLLAPGTGMGLDIVRRLIFNQKGDIDVESQPGRTVFRVVIPVATATPASVAAV